MTDHEIIKRLDRIIELLEAIKLQGEVVLPRDARDKLYIDYQYEFEERKRYSILGDFMDAGLESERVGSWDMSMGKKISYDEAMKNIPWNTTVNEDGVIKPMTREIYDQMIRQGWVSGIDGSTIPLTHVPKNENKP